MRSYQQYCGLARGLDVIGDRWVLLIVRELLGGPRRYSEVARGLPGIASNLLAERLRAMETNGLIARTHDDRYELTELGDDLRGVLNAIGRWARPLMGVMAEGDTFCSHWIAHPIAAMFPDDDHRRPDVTVEVRCGDEPMTVRSANGRVSVHAGHAAAPDVVVTGPPDATVGLLAGQIDLAGAKHRGLAITGHASLVRRLSKTAR